MGRRLVQALSQLSQDIGIDIVTPEFEILLVLLGAGNLSTENLCDSSSLSRSGFFNALDRLKHWGLVVCEVSANDRRRKTCRLRPRAEAMVAANFEQFRKSKQMAELLFERGENGSPAPPDAAPDAPDLRIPDPASPAAQPRLLQRPDRRGNRRLAQHLPPAIGLLLEMRLLHRESCDADRRRTRYFLPQGVIQAIDRATEQLFSWLDDTAPAPALRAPEPPSPQPGHGHTAAVPAPRR